MGFHHFFSGKVQPVRRILDSLNPIRVRKAARELAHDLAKFLVGRAYPRGSFHDVIN